jgi:cystathionine beta-lyase/cystathionine gamma-synthase
MTVLIRRPSTPPPDAPNEEALIRASLDELAHDLDEVGWLAWDLARRVRERARALVAARRHLDGDSLDEIERHLRAIMSAAEAIRREAAIASADTRARHPTLALLDGLTAQRAALADRVRTIAGIAAAAMVAAEWQSPSFGHSIRPNAGTRTGLVEPHHDDYRRDRHADAASLERAYVDAFVGRDDVGALATSCGMSAFTTILAFLRATGRLERVVMGRSAYHESRELVRASVPSSALVEVDEAEIASAIGRVHPTAVFVDALANAPGVAVADVEAILRSMRSGTLVVDTTGGSCTTDPFALERPRGVRLVAFESLTKFAQFGLDRVTGGMILASTDDARALDLHREHLGTNIADASVYAFPAPDRGRLERRLRRIGRNAERLAERLAEVADGIVVGVDHPSRPDHPAAARARPLRFRGGWLTLRFAPAFDRSDVREAFVSLAIEEARVRRVPLVAGASFGLDVCRIYATGSSAATADPFVRISPGIEHVVDVERLAASFRSAMRRLSTSSAVRSATRGTTDRLGFDLVC